MWATSATRPIAALHGFFERRAQLRLALERLVKYVVRQVPQTHGALDDRLRVRRELLDGAACKERVGVGGGQVPGGLKCPVGGATSASTWWLQKVWKPSGPSQREGRRPPEGGAHLGHVFRGQARADLGAISAPATTFFKVKSSRVKSSQVNPRQNAAVPRES